MEDAKKKEEAKEVSPVVEFKKPLKLGENTYTAITLRAPLILDELAADAMRVEALGSEDKQIAFLAKAENFKEVCMIARCAVHLSGAGDTPRLDSVKPDHLIRMSRADFVVALSKIYELEDADAEREGNGSAASGGAS